MQPKVNEVPSPAPEPKKEAPAAAPAEKKEEASENPNKETQKASPGSASSSGEPETSGNAVREGNQPESEAAGPGTSGYGSYGRCFV